jgi:hypothetical protein
MKRTALRWLLVISTVLGLPLLCRPAAAQQFEQLDPARWTNTLTLYLWLPAESGDITVRGQTAHVDTSISDAWDALKHLTSALTLHYEGSKCRYTTILDIFYIKLEGSATVGENQDQVTFRPTETIAEAVGAYTVYQKMEGDTTVADTQILGGLRYTNLGLGLSSSATGISLSDSKGWVDPFIGARYRRILSRRWGYSIRGDVGGSGIGTSSHFVWNVILDARYSLSHQWAIDLGWRWLDYNHSTGGGDDLFRYDVLANGPFMGFTYGF